MKIDIRIIASLLTAPFIILICIGELFLIIWIILKSLGCLFYFVTRLAKKKGTNILNKERQRLTAPPTHNQQHRRQRYAAFPPKPPDRNAAPSAHNHPSAHHGRVR